MPPARWYSATVFSNSATQHIDFTAKGLAANVLTVVDAPGHTAPSVQAVQRVGPFEYLLSGTINAAAEKSPQCGVDNMDLLSRESKPHRLLKFLNGHCLEVFLLYPLKNVLQNKKTGNEVALYLPFSTEAALQPTKAVFFMSGELIIE